MPTICVVTACHIGLATAAMGGWPHRSATGVSVDWHAAQCRRIDSSDSDALLAAMMPAQLFGDSSPQWHVRDYARVALRRESPHVPSVLVVWYDQLNDAVLVGLRASGCLWHPGVRGAGWGVWVHPRAQQQWNQVITSGGGDSLLVDPSLARALALAYIAFATGRPIALAPEDGSTGVDVALRPGSKARVSEAYAIAVYRRDGDWEVTGHWTFRARYGFVIRMATSGAVVTGTVRPVG